MNVFANILNHPKTSIAGILISVMTITGVLSQQGITLGKAGTGTIVALIGALAAGLLGLLSRDPGTPDGGSSSSSATAGKVASILFIVGIVGVASMMLTGCPDTSTAVHKASVAAAGVGDSLSQFATLNHQLIQAGAETPQEGATMAGLIDQAALSNDAFVRTLQSVPDTGSAISTAQALAAFSTLQQQIANLNQEGVLHLKSASAQAKFATAMTALQAGIAAIEVVTAAVSPQSSLPPASPHHAPLWPLGLPAIGFAALVLTPAELDELISLALAAGSALVTKLVSLKGETDPQLQAEALSSDAAAEQQAQADEAQPATEN